MNIKDRKHYSEKLLGDVQYLRKKLIKLSYLLDKQESEDLYFAIYQVEGLTEQIIDRLMEEKTNEDRRLQMGN